MKKRAAKDNTIHILAWSYYKIKTDKKRTPCVKHWIKIKEDKNDWWIKTYEAPM